MNDEINVVMILLEKAEQILSYVNLPLSTLKKYNELKEKYQTICSLKWKMKFNQSILIF